MRLVAKGGLAILCLPLSNALMVKITGYQCNKPVGSWGLFAGTRRSIEAAMRDNKELASVAMLDEAK